MPTNDQDRAQQEILDFTEFPTPDLAQWRTEVERLLKGASFDKRMITRTLEGPTLQPLYAEETAEPVDPAPFVRGRAPRSAGEPWRLIADPTELEAEIDPLSVAALSGGIIVPADWDALHRTGPERMILIDTAPYAEGGADVVLQLACAMAAGVEILRELESRGEEILTSALRLCAGFRIGSHLFVEAAKLRAARQMWHRILEVADIPLESRGLSIHAATASRSKSLYDPHTNILRATTETFAAIIGGADTIHVAPFDALSGEASDLGRRVARNIQLILRDEAHLGRVQDPGGGSWYLEQLTRDLADSAWNRFQAIEAVGGMSAALAKGMIRQWTTISAAARAQAAATGRKTIVGVNRYPAPENLGDSTAAVPADDGESDPSIAPRREAEPFERLRIAIERHRAAVGELEIFIATLGPVGRYMPRLDFITSFFGAGGFGLIRTGGFKSPEAAALAATAAAPVAVVIVGADDTWAEDAPATAALIRAADPSARIYLAGLPRDGEILAALQDAGVSEFIHLRSDMPDVLGDLAATLEVQV
ncbi:MAG: hypothetical protein GY835_01070 [bacterium]|nr:hypothetical protein [bacterium]